MKDKFFKLFRDNLELDKAILLEETCPLPGLRTTYLWEQMPDKGFLKINKTDLKNSINNDESRRSLDESEVAKLIATLDEGGASLGDFQGNVKDGIYYWLGWGNPNDFKYLSFSNPQHGSPNHQKLISVLRKSVSE